MEIDLDSSSAIPSQNNKGKATGRILKRKRENANTEETGAPRKARSSKEQPDTPNIQSTNNPKLTDSSQQLPDLTPLSRDSFPPVHGLNEKDLYSTVHPELLVAWHKAPGPKAIAYIANDKPVDEGTARVNLITTLLKEVLGSPTVFVGHACPVHNNRHPERKLAFPYLIGGISEAQIQTLTDRRCWLTPNITIFVLLTEPPLSSYIMTLANISLEDTGANNLQVQEAVATRL